MIINRYSPILFQIEYKKNIDKKQEQNFAKLLKKFQKYDINGRNKIIKFNYQEILTVKRGDDIYGK